jgi:hypothetical protein
VCDCTSDGCANQGSCGKEPSAVSVVGEYHGGIAFPTACDEQGRLYVKLIKIGPGMMGPLFRLSSKGVVETEFDTRVLWSTATQSGLMVASSCCV